MQNEFDIATKIRTRAYQLWEAEGRPHGRDQAHWYQAESELQPAGPARARRSTVRSTRAAPASPGRQRKAPEATA